jgi:hypothetical protein
VVNEQTWGVPAKQTPYKWEAVEDGVQIIHQEVNDGYLVPWDVFYSVFNYAREHAVDNRINAGTSMTSPTPGSVGSWVQTMRFSLDKGTLTPRHLSFLGPIYGRMGFVDSELDGNSIIWIVN